MNAIEMKGLSKSFRGLFSIKIWFNIGGFMIWLAWLGWNLPPILIQRYNRPRLKNILKNNK